MDWDIDHYTCFQTPETILVDGRLDEPVWNAAPWSKPFVDIVTGRPAWFDTRVALLWDAKYLYFGFRAEEPFLRGHLTERDSKIYEDNDLEIFIAGKDAYYEFEINALNTIYEVFWIWKDILAPGSIYYGVPEFDPARHRMMTLSGIGGHVHPRGERWGFLDWDLPGLRHAVHLDGTINDHADADEGWTAEIAIPWEGLRWLADGRPLPPAEGDVWRVDCSRFQQVDKEGRKLSPSPGWTWNRHGHYDSHIPETFTFVHFSKKQAGR